MRGSFPVVILLATLPMLAAQPDGSLAPDPWAQMHGGADHAGRVNLGAGPLDILGDVSILPEGDRMWHPGYLRTPYGLTTDYVGQVEAQSDFDCGFLHVSDPSVGTFEVIGTDTCNQPELFAYDAARNLLLFCISGRPDQPVVVARNPETGEQAWALTPTDIGAVEPDVLVPGVSPTTWHCTAGALDPHARQAIVGIHAPLRGRGMVASIDVDDGSVHWARGTSAAPAAGQGDPPVAQESATLVRILDAGFEADEVTITARGLAVAGDLEDSVQAVLWMDRDGTILGGRSAQPTETESGLEPSTARSRSGAWTGLSNGHAAIVLDRRLVVANPASPQPEAELALDADEPLGEASLYPWPATWDDVLVTPLTHSIHVFHGASRGEPVPAWRWYPGVAWRISSTVVAPPGDLIVLATENAAGGERGVLVRLDLESGTPTQELTLPVVPRVESRIIEGVEVNRWFAALSPGPSGGLVVADSDGQLVLLGAAPESAKPDLALSSAFPSVGDEVLLQPAPASPVVAFHVYWGEGAIQRIGPNDASRYAYATEGERTIWVTAVFENGRTATTQRVVDVGGSAPGPGAKRNFIEQALAPENYDLTFGILGIALALGGGVAAVARQRGRRGRVRRQLAIIERSVAAAGNDADAAERALAAERTRVHGLGIQGRMDPAEVSLLERRIDELGGIVRLKALDERFGFLTLGMARVLRDVLEDSRVTTVEKGRLLDALDKDDAMTGLQKRRVRAQIEAWSRKDQRARERRAESD